MCLIGSRTWLRVTRYVSYRKQDLTIRVTRHVSYRKQELITHREDLGSPRFYFCEVLFVHLFSILCCFFCFVLILRRVPNDACVSWVGVLYVLSSVLWCPLLFPHITLFASSLSFVVCRRAHVLFMLFVFVWV
jgi:hypothetical protein